MNKEDDLMNKIKNPWEFFAYCIRYRTKEILAIIAIVLLGYILVANVSYSKKDGFSWRPSVSIEVKR